MPDILDEIKEDLQHEKYAKLWDQYSTHVLALIISAVVLTGGYVGWISYQAKKHEQTGTKLYSAMMQERGENPDAILQLYTDIEKNGSGSQAGASALREASVLISEGKTEDAEKLYQKIAANSAYPQEIRDLAELLSINNSLNASVGKDNSELVAKLNKMAAGDGVFKYSAKELLGFAELEAGKTEEAKKIFEELNSDNNTPPAIRDRSSGMISVISGKV